MVFAEEAGPHVGIAMDTGNAFAVAEDPVAFAKRVAPRIKHVHLKDYVSQFTPEGFRLIRCAIGDGCVPLQEIAEVFFRLPAFAKAPVSPKRGRLRRARRRKGGSYAHCLNRSRSARRAAHPCFCARLVGGISDASGRRTSDRARPTQDQASG